MRDEEMDKLFRSSIENLEGPPPQARYWNTEETFEKIQENLNNPSGRRYPGIFDLAAAAVALLCTLGYLLSTSHQQKEGANGQAEMAFANPGDTAEDPGLVSSFFTRLQQIGQHEDAELVNLFSRADQRRAQPFMLDEITVFSGSFDFEENAANVAQLPARMEQSLASYTSFDQLAIPDFTFASPEEQVNKGGTSFNIEIPVGIGWAARSLAPVLGARLTASFGKGNAEKYTTVSAGATTYHLVSNSPEDGLQAATKVFAEVAMGRHSTDKSKTITGHEFGAGYLLNGDDIRFNGKTFKVNYSISLKDKIQISPEVIFTGNFSKAYPGVRVNLI